MSKRTKAIKRLAATSNPTLKPREGKAFSRIVETAVIRTRADIDQWRAALRIAESVENPRRVRLYNIFAEVELDALLSSQMDNRKLKSISAPFDLVTASGEVDAESTARLADLPFFRDLQADILSTIYYGHALFELQVEPGGKLSYTVVPKKNVIPEKGLVLLHETDTGGIRYRELPEFNTWLIEVGRPKDLGLLNKVVPHVLFKRFAQSCWSELCEIYGIPPRIGKTNTQDPEMLDRMDRMMRDMGSAAYMIIDDTEEFQFAAGVSTNGDVYNNLIRLCNNEISLAVSGAIVGQDTKNGNESKEQISIGMLSDLVESDKQLLTNCWNSLLLPALYRIGLLPDGLKFRYRQQHNIEKLWAMTYQAAQIFDVDPAFVNDTFGIPVKPKALPNQGTTLEHNLSGSFFG